MIDGISRKEYLRFLNPIKPMQNPMINKPITVLLASMLFISTGAVAGTANYSATTNIFDNPERGFHDLISNAESFNPSVSAHPVASVSIRLDRFKHGAALDSCFLTTLANSFAAARTAGVKIRVYFKYNWGPATNQSDYTACNGQIIHNDGQDASITTILSHISQLGPTLNAYSDVIYEINAGFIGQFGEWHDSTNGNDTISRHNQVITAELNNFPTNRDIVLRRPAYKLNYIGCNCPGTNPRLGHHNERFVDDSDLELFNDPQGVWSSTDCRSFYDNDVSFTANGADAASGAGSIDGITALNRMQQYHYSIMSAYPNLISSWQTNYPSQYSTMQQKLGYRFQVTSATTPTTATRGVSYPISVTLKDNGFSKMINQRAMWAAFNIGSSWAFSSTTLADSTGSDDLRGLRLADINGKVYSANFTLPTSFPTGTANVYLWLPDYAAGLQIYPAFSVQLDGVTWSPSLGANLLGSSLNHIQVQ